MESPCIKRKYVPLILMFIFFVLFLPDYIGAVLINSTKTENAESINGYFLQNVANKLAEEFEKMNLEELGVSFIKKIYKKFKYVAAIQDVDKSLNRIANNIEFKLNSAFSLLFDAKAVIETYKDVLPELYSLVTPCNINDTNSFDVFSLNVDVNSTMEQIKNFDFVFNNKESNLSKLKGAVKLRYFLSAEDVLKKTVSPINNCDVHDHTLLWKNYISHITYPKRTIMLLLDHGGSLSNHQFRIVKILAKQIISTLSDDDNLGLMAISDDWSVPYSTDKCLMPNQIHPLGDLYKISPVTKHNKDILNKFIDSLMKGNGITNHTLGLKQALNLIKSSKVPGNGTVMLLYISRGLLSTLTEEKTVLETLASLHEDLDFSILINTCAVIDETKPVMYEMHFLQDIADQNYSKYNITIKKEFKKGLMLSVDKNQSAGFAVVKFYNTINKPTYLSSAKLTLPTWDSISKDLSVSATVACGKFGEIGVLGIDLYFSNLVEDVTYYSNYPNVAYAFLITTDGLTVMHPYYPRPNSIKKQIKFVDVSLLERFKNFDKIRTMLLKDVKGSEVLIDGNEKRKYVWKRIMDWYVVCIVIRESEQLPNRPISWFSNSASNQFIYHRLDILPATNLCRHLNQIATLDAGSLYLSPSCFQSPFTHASFSTNTASGNIQNYMAYLKDKTRLLANPGLKEEVRDDVTALAYVLEFLRNQHLTGYKTKYIVRRYVASHSGVIQMFPGSIISASLDPTKRNWFLSAIEHPELTILTPPYLDAGGAGYIVTIAYATQHVVTALDVTYGYVYKLLLEQMPFCNEKNIKCFLIEDRGYLIYHPQLIDPNGHGPIEQQHIIHKESLVANDILNHEHFVKKMLCNNYADGTIQRYYKLNIGLTGVLSNAVHGEHCVKYHVSVVSGTNMFVGIVNATCEVVATFCPCSMIDRFCLNCNRMEQKECECPCECPLNLDTCPHPNGSFIKNPLCTTIPEQSFIQHEPHLNAPDLKPCIPFVCESQMTYSSCLGITGCEWCRFDADGESLLAHPFCTSLSTCFNGILGSPTPYGDATSDLSSTQDLLGTPYSPVGPVTGSVIAMCVLLTLLFFCYRSYTSPSVERFYLASTQDNQVRMSDLNINDEYQEIDNHQDKLLQENTKHEPISPYCISTTYRRPVTVADSDHGYSTMTPHDESEHLSFAPVEIDSLEDECTSDNASINTSVSSKPNCTENRAKNKNTGVDPVYARTTTTLPQKKYIIAPVTVHRNMEMMQ